MFVYVANVINQDFLMLQNSSLQHKIYLWLSSILLVFSSIVGFSLLVFCEICKYISKFNLPIIVFVVIQSMFGFGIQTIPRNMKKSESSLIFLFARLLDPISLVMFVQIFSYFNSSFYYFNSEYFLESILKFIF